MSNRRRMGIVLGVLVLSGLLASNAALGAAPTIERIEFDETFEDEFLSGECGVAVTTTLEGKIIIRSFLDATEGVRQVSTINLGYTATSPYGKYNFRDVGADVARVQPDGTLVISIIGQVPFGFTGIIKLDGDDNVIFESNGDRGEKQLATACAALSP